MELSVTVPGGLTSRADWRHGDDLEAVFTGEAVHDALCVEYASLGSFEQPLDIRRLGIDAFTRGVVSRPLAWFSVDGQVRHSGSKRAAETNLPGERYCDLCGRCVSANNSWSQHMKRVHSRERRYAR